MNTDKECRCCRDYETLVAMMEEGNSCITSLHGFKVNCLDPEVLKVSFYEYAEQSGPIGDDEPIHEYVVILIQPQNYLLFTQITLARLIKVCLIRLVYMLETIRTPL